MASIESFFIVIISLKLFFKSVNIMNTIINKFIPIVMAAIVIVIISRGIPNIPIIPRIKAAKKFGITPIIESVIFLKSNKKHRKYSKHNYP